MPIKPWRATCIQMPSRVARTAAGRSEASPIIDGNIERGLMLIDRSWPLSSRPGSSCCRNSRSRDRPAARAWMNHRQGLLSGAR